METVYFLGILHFYGRGSSEYFVAVFTIGVINIALYLVAIWESRKHDIWYVWIPMAIFLVIKLAIYIASRFITRDRLADAHEVLNVFNLACFTVWTVAFLLIKPGKEQRYE
jgi:hypothetical protein